MIYFTAATTYTYPLDVKIRDNAAYGLILTQGHGKSCLPLPSLPWVPPSESTTLQESSKRSFQVDAYWIAQGVEHVGECIPVVRSDDEMSTWYEHAFYFQQWLLQRLQPLGHTYSKNKMKATGLKRKILYVGNLERHSFCQPRLLGPYPRRRNHLWHGINRFHEETTLGQRNRGQALCASHLSRA